jgi:hypothetical protein
VLNAEPQDKSTGIFEFSLAKQTDAIKQDDSRTAVQTLIEMNAEPEGENQSRGQN